MSAPFNSQNHVKRSNSFQSTFAIRDPESFGDLKKTDRQEYTRSIKSQYLAKNNLLNTEGGSFSKNIISVSNRSLNANKAIANSINHPDKDDRKRSKFSLKFSNFSSFIKTKQKKIKSMFDRNKTQLPKENFVNKFTSSLKSKNFFDQSRKHLYQSSRSLNSFFSLPTSHNNFDFKTNLFQLVSKSDSIILHKEITEDKLLKSSNMQQHANNVCVF